MHQTLYSALLRSSNIHCHPLGQSAFSWSEGCCIWCNGTSKTWSMTGPQCGSCIEWLSTSHIRIWWHRVELGLHPLAGWLVASSLRFHYWLDWEPVDPWTYRTSKLQPIDAHGKHGLQTLLVLEGVILVPVQRQGFYYSSSFATLWSWHRSCLWHQDIRNRLCCYCLYDRMNV